MEKVVLYGSQLHLSGKAERTEVSSLGLRAMPVECPRQSQGEQSSDLPALRRFFEPSFHLQNLHALGDIAWPQRLSERHHESLSEF